MRYTISADGGSITCGNCGLVSYNKNDVEQHYCGRCHIFHDDAAAEHSCAVEYNCSECGRHIYQFGGPQTGKCAACWTIPGWFNDPEIAQRIDPQMARQPRRRLH